MFASKLIYIPWRFCIYCFLICFLIFLMSLDQFEIAIIVAPILPIILLTRFQLRFTTLFDFRFVYLISIFIWSFGKALSVYMSYGNFTIKEDFVWLYTICMVLSPTLSYLYKLPGSNSYFSRVRNKKSNKLYIFLLILIWFLINFIFLFSLTNSDNDSSAFVLKHLSQGFVLVFASIVVLTLYNSSTLWSKSLIPVVVIITVFTFLQGALNRTSLLLPVLLLIATIVSESKILNFRINVIKTLIVTVLSIPMLLLLLLIADIQKFTISNPFMILWYIEDNPDVIVDVIKNSNYIPDKSSAVDYFNNVGAIVEAGQYLPGGLFYQLASSVMPRLFFPDKGITDLSQLMWDKGLIDYPLYYEIFLEPIIDSSVIGVIFYYSFFLLFVRISWTCMTTFTDGFRGTYSRSVYILNLIILFMIIRGPIIFIIWYGLLPNIILWYWLFLSRFRKY